MLVAHGTVFSLYNFYAALPRDPACLFRICEVIATILQHARKATGRDLPCKPMVK
jgi:hypothetical protein